MKKIILSIDGMTCSACSSGLEKYLNKQKGIEKVEVNLVMATANIKYDEKILNLGQIETFVKKAGFKSLGEFKEIQVDKKNKIEKVKFNFYTILAIFLMYVSMGSMIGLPYIPGLNPHENTIGYVYALLVITICFLIYGYDILKNGFKNLIHGTPNMDTLVGIGVITSFLYSIYNMILVLNGNHHLVMSLYFESSCIVIYFIKLGRYIDGASKNKTREAIKKLVEVTPNKANILVDGKIREVTLDEISKGDIVVCKAGEKIAVDGEIVKGKAHVDESFITGESKPVSKSEGNKVIAGSLNYDGYIEYKAERIGKESTISEIVRIVVEATNTKAPIAKIADKVSGIFVPIVMAIAIVTFMIILIMGQGFELAIKTFTTILVVACPCSLGLATPLAIVVSEELCASKGILIKKSEILERACKINTIVFDKTGTLTYGKLKISEIRNYSKYDNNELIKIASSIELKSTHPISNAFITYLEDNRMTTIDVTDYKNIEGYGVRATVNEKNYLIGNAKLMENNGVDNEYKDEETDLAKQGNSIVYIAENKKIIALIGVNDIIKDEGVNTIKVLNDLNVETIMLTGDNENTANIIAKKLGISTVISNVLPSKKADCIRDLMKNNKIVAMCGDGINDSPALTSADIGISIGNGTDIAMDSSDVILTSNNINSIVDLINISKKTTRIIKQNLFWAFFYNCLMIPIAMGLFRKWNIEINPMIASFAMVISSLIVILNTIRLRYIIKK
ncbi:MAG: copper-translocating P-type ATPase [Clostridia bacterium]|nr:copper-translocating P-type ATPase [Clostridia bacterium]